MANEIKINIKTNIDGQPITKLKNKINEIKAPTEKIENKLSKITDRIKIFKIEKLREKLSKIMPTTKNLERLFNNLSKRISKINLKTLEKIPLLGKVSTKSFGFVGRQFSKINSLGKGVGSLFTSMKGKVKTAFSKVPLDKFKNGLNAIKEKTKGVISGIKGIIGKLGLVGGLVGGLSFAGIAQASDTNALRNSRLEMVTKDIEGLKNKVFKESQVSGSDYGAQLDSVAKLKMLTNGLFNDSEAVKFTATLDKAFKVAGTAPEEAASAMFQLNQAMTSGKLQGDEFRSVMENAPILAQKIADSMGISMGELKNVASKGKITSDVIKKAVLGSADEIETKYKEMPITFSKVFSQAKNAGLKAMDSMLTKVNALVNTDAGKKVAEDLQRGMVGMSNGFSVAFDNMLKLFSKLDFSKLINPLMQLGVTIGNIFNKNMNGGAGFIEGIAGAMNRLINLGGIIVGLIDGALQNINFEQIGQIIGNIGNAFATLFKTINFGSVWNLLGMAFNMIMEALVMITPLFAPIMQVLGNIFNFIVQILTALMPVIDVAIKLRIVLFSTIVPVLQIIINIFIMIGSVVVEVFSLIFSTVGRIMNGILEIISGVINSISGVINQISVFFTNAFNKAKNVAQEAINGIKGFIDGLFGKIGELGNKIGGALSKLNPFKGKGGKVEIGHNYTGTRSWRGGLTTVAEKGAEMIKIPGQSPFLAGSEMLMNLPQGTEILTTENTQREMNSNNFGSMQSPKFKGSTTNNHTTNTENSSKEITFSPTIIVQNSSNDDDIESKINRVLNRFFEEKIISMGV